MNDLTEYIRIFNNLEKPFLVFNKSLEIVHINKYSKVLFDIKPNKNISNLKELFGNNIITKIKKSSCIFTNQKTNTYTLNV